jgi:hypothetical protein
MRSVYMYLHLTFRTDSSKYTIVNACDSWNHDRWLACTTSHQEQELNTSQPASDALSHTSGSCRNIEYHFARASNVRFARLEPELELTYNSS